MLVLLVHVFWGVVNIRIRAVCGGYLKEGLFVWGEGSESRGRGVIKKPSDK